MSTNLETMDKRQVSRFFRSFELTTKYWEFVGSDKPLFSQLSQLIKGGLEYQFLPYYFSDVPNWRLSLRKLRSKERMAPNYVMTGPCKSGSSDLVSHLLFHPNVMPPLAKEPKMHKVKNWRMGYPTVQEQQELEESVGGPVRCGYLDPELFRLDVMQRLYELNPNCKVIITLRDPVDRAYSFWKWELFLGVKTLARSKNREYFNNYSDYISRALEVFPSMPMDSLTGPQVLANGIYYQAVEHWIKRFGRENVMVLDVAEYFKNRQPVFERIQEFLEIPVIGIPELNAKINENPTKMPPADEETKAKLAEFYRPFNDKLFALLDQEFDWQ
ncbi:MULTISPECIES: sulfotransferase domain-containing protein [Pseudoalteromonas]|uniref:sulfotransferase domain-containing protein n=1 Tax=Pseudoalteromonas TaxID=53246 RepID=UPI0002DC273C|nr:MULTISPECIES: sulfotransferase domain-containing protein [Pseudoalteromonas]MDP4489530.1 sulfotransferase domain-containing protein [Pseudoalteromonas piscicida]